jgi:glycosyltransferase involved in cell wall biosynthesis
MSIKILHINTFDVGGGAEQFSVDLFTAQPQSQLLVKKKFLDNDRIIEVKYGVIDYFFTFIDKAIWKLGLKKSFKTCFSITEEYNHTYKKLKELKEYREADIIHLHNIHGGYFDLNALKQISREKKIVWTLHDMWLVTGGEAYMLDFEGFKTGNAKSPYIAYPPLNKPWIDRRDTFLKRKKKLLEKISNNLTLVPVSGWLEQQVKQAYVYNAHVRVHTIKNGINTKTFYNIDKRDWKVPRILFFNSGSPYKGSQFFKNILSDINVPCEIWVVGKGELAAPAHVLVVYMDTIRDRERLNDVYNSTDILVFGSLAENLSLIVLETMSAGVFPIASNVGGMPEIIINDTVGCLFNVADKETLTREVNHALTNIEITREKGRNASHHIKEHFDFNAMVKKYEHLYKTILEK